MPTKTYIIAEAGVNHNGSLEKALALIDVAVEAGADAIKFQTFQAKHLVTQDAAKADYQLKTTDPEESQHDMLSALELDQAAHERLIDVCKKKNIDFLSTPFDFPSVDLLVEQLGLKTIKVSSGDLTNAPLLLTLARTGCNIILSSGMALLGDIEDALSVVAFGYLNPTEAPSQDAFSAAYCSEKGRAVLREKVKLLHCTSEYPAPYDNVNLKAIETLGQAFQLPIGLSDHTDGIAIPLAAVARGAEIIEKHITLDKTLPGPDHLASLEPQPFIDMVQGIRQIEKALGTSSKIPSYSERSTRDVARKSLVANTAIKKGEAFTAGNLSVKRPGSGRSPHTYWHYLTLFAERDYQAGELI